MKPELVSVWATVGEHEHCAHDPVFSGGYNPMVNPWWDGICSLCGVVGKWQFESAEHRPIAANLPRFNELLKVFKHGQ